MAYMTKQQQAVLACIRGCADGIGAAELTEQVHKIVTDTGAKYQFCSCYQSGKDCFLLKCERCGAVQHADCSRLAPLYRHLEEEHGFAIDPHRTLFYGLCRQCREAVE